MVFITMVLRGQSTPFFMWFLSLQILPFASPLILIRPSLPPYHVHILYFISREIFLWILIGRVVCMYVYDHKKNWGKKNYYHKREVLWRVWNYEIFIWRFNKRRVGCLMRVKGGVFCSAATWCCKYVRTTLKIGLLLTFSYVFLSNNLNLILLDINKKIFDNVICSDLLITHVKTIPAS